MKIKNKCLLSAFLTVLSGHLVLAQWDVSGDYKISGKVGIGTNNPVYKLEIEDFDPTFNIKSTSNNREINIKPGTGVIESTNANLSLNRFSNHNIALVLGGGNVGIGTAHPIHKLDLVDVNPTFRIQATINNRAIRIEPSVGIIDSDNTTLHLNRSSSHNVTMVNGGGNVGIGLLDPGADKLAVNGNIKAWEVKVTLTGWPDFVFEDDHDLPTLEEVEKFIKANKHLPEIPSAKEVRENGVELGKMDSKLLQKIEELTLYIIDQEKRIKKLEAMNSQLMKEKKK